MRYLPIPYTDEMVRAILRDVDPKTQTRRLGGLKMINERPDSVTHVTLHEDGVTWLFWYGADCYKAKCPFGAPGDRHYVRERWKVASSWDDTKPSDLPHSAFVKGCDVIYGSSLNAQTSLDGRWRPPMFMPKAFSRISAEVLSVRPERVQAISEDDAKAEGCIASCVSTFSCLEKELIDWPLMSDVRPYANTFALLWDSINMDRGYGWYKNPWCWRIEFRRLA